MPAKITLEVVKGQLGATRFSFDERAILIIGKSEDCHIRVPADERYKMISRRHCLLDIHPPYIRARDLGSLDGTYVNDTLIGRRAKHQTPEEGARGNFKEHDLKDGDELRFGAIPHNNPKEWQISLRVGVSIPVYCAKCGVEIPESEKSQFETASGVYQCQSCLQKSVAAHAPTRIGAAPHLCAHCGRDVSEEAGTRGRGDYICAKCRAGVSQLVRDLLREADAGKKELLAIRGYEIERELGRGGNGSIYLARQTKTGRRVALKVMAPEVAASERAVEDFLREIENTKALRHPNIVEMRDWGFSNGIFFFTMEYCDSGSAYKLVESHRGGLAVELALHIIFQALDGLAYAHQAEIPFVKLNNGSIGRGRGLVHRDISPDNILLCGAGAQRDAKLADFGLAKAFELAGLSLYTRTGTAAGKPWFMPRQQVVNYKYVQPEVDVWAMAATLYFMLTGLYTRDFPKGQDPWNVVLKTRPVPIRKRKASIPSGLAEVIDLALVDKPEMRFKSALEFKRALDGAMR
jgi:eukaryotic-like serine/threonine-protein kinase